MLRDDLIFQSGAANSNRFATKGIILNDIYGTNGNCFNDATTPTYNMLQPLVKLKSYEFKKNLILFSNRKLRLERI